MIVNLRGGTYTAPEAGLVQSADGTLADPITYRSFRGEWAIIDHPYAGGNDAGGILTVNGDHVLFDYIGITNSNPDRGDTDVDMAIVSYRSEGVSVFGLGSEVRHSVITDTGDGIGHWSTTAGGSAYGNLVLDVGWVDEDRGHGHGIYTQNPPGDPKTIKHNVFSAPYSSCIKTAGSEGAVASYRVDENTCCFGGVRDPLADLLDEKLGIQHYAFHTVSEDMKWRGNISYQPGGVPWASFFGADYVHADAEISDNWLYGGWGIEFTRPWSNITATDNIVTASVVLWGEASPPPTTRDYARNTYHYTGALVPFWANGAGCTFAQWKTVTGADADATYDGNEPAAATWVREDLYEPHRGLVTIWNPSEAATVNVDLDAVLDQGTAYWIFNALNPYAAPVASGTHTNGVPVTFPTTGLTNRTPAGDDPLPHDPKMSVFVVRSVATWVAP